MAALPCCTGSSSWCPQHQKDFTGLDMKIHLLAGISVENTPPASPPLKLVPIDASITVDEPEISPLTTLTPSLNVAEDLEVLPQTQRALAVVAKGQYDLLDSQPIPEFENENEVLIRNYAVGLNPIDWKTVDYNFCLPAFPWVTGREMAGVVEKVAPGVQGFKKGDQVWTSTYYRDIRAGCFQELVIVPQHTVSIIPSNLTFESAACLGVAALTAAMTLWKWFGVPIWKTNSQTFPDSEREYLLVWGGSTITGQFAIQIAVQCGLNVIAVTSEKTKSRVQALGAQVVTRDLKTEVEILAEISMIAGESITKAIDLVGRQNTACTLLAVSRSRAVDFAPLSMMGKHSTAKNVSIHTVEMKRFILDEESAVYSKALNQMIEKGLISIPEIQILAGGLSAIENGLDMLKRGDMNGKKLIVPIIDSGLR